nr:hypothetical protein [Tanacetum cinerariifolium]
MSGAIPPILPPFGASSGNPGSPNRVYTMPTSTDPINTTTTANVTQSVVDKNLHQLLDSRGGFHVTNVPAFDKEDFTSWKVRFLVFLDGFEPYLLKTLEDGPFVPMSSLSTFENPLPKRQNQLSNDENRLANQDKQLKSIIIYCLPNDVMKSVITCKIAKEMWNDLILAHEGPSDTTDTKIAALRLKFNAFKSLEGEKVMGTFTRLKCLLNDLENNGVIIPQAEVNVIFVNSMPRKWLSMNQTQRENNSIKNDSSYTIWQDSDSDVEEDQRTSNEFMADLNVKYHEKALLANHKRFYKRPGKDEGTTRIRAFIAIAKDEPSVRKADARSGQWVDITMKKVHRLLSMTNSDDIKHVLDYTHVDLIYVEDQRKNMVNKYNLLKQELSLHKSELSNLKNTMSINCSFQNEVIIVNLENESLKDEIFDLKRVIENGHVAMSSLTNCSLSKYLAILLKPLVEKDRRKENNPLKEVLFTKAHVSTSESAPMITYDSEDDSDIQEPLPLLLKLIGVDPFSASKSLISLSDLTANMADLTLNNASKEIKKSNKVSQTYVIKKRTESKHPVV